MMDGFNKLTCLGIVGDGCGGGREFIVENKTLVAYDPQTKEEILLLEDIENAHSISKDGCIITIGCKTQEIRFDLSTLKRV